MFEGKNVALVATGGGSRGLAHIGVLSACEEMGIKINLIIGASAGALIGAYYSQYQSADKLIDHFRPKTLRKYKFSQFGWRRMFSLQRIVSPNIVKGLFDLHHAEAFLEKSFPINDFNKLVIPVYVAATNLNDHSGVLFGQDYMSHVPISKAVIASCCVPILFRPIEIESKYYIDGEIKRPLSIDAAIEKGADIVIVSDTYGSMLKNVQQMGMLDIASEVINMILEDKSMRGVDLSKRKYPDKQIIVVSPKVNHISAFNSYAYERLIAAGYGEAMKSFQEVRDGVVR